MVVDIYQVVPHLGLRSAYLTHVHTEKECSTIDEAIVQYSKFKQVHTDLLVGMESLPVTIRSNNRGYAVAYYKGHPL